MKKIVIVACLAMALSMSSSAADRRGSESSSEQTIQFIPYGTWQICAANASIANTLMCEGTQAYVKGQEPDLLLVSAARPDTVAFLYTVTGTDITGQAKTYTGIFLRNDSLPWVTASHATVNAGTLRGLSITIQELTTAMIRQQSQE